MFTVCRDTQLFQVTMGELFIKILNITSKTLLLSILSKIGH
ncbi:hypothetical protein QP686_02870 [Streptococcus intermedius]|nr:hypothetical protein [Streptococcus intermedius]MDK8090797.1 hypothetical protein [Streptococcus intermedius]